ncbi:MAG TPA: NUDIX hydrolase [Polyangiaceae bacterium]|nr:NUDIX hydrolase [Polyangiaceae bacterium]
MTAEPTSHGPKPTALDLLVRGFYVVAYQIVRIYWQIFNPFTHGVLVAVFNEGAVLLVQNSYVNYVSMPGGYLRRGETSVQAAIRELHEETGLWAKAEELVPLLDQTAPFEGKKDRVEIFALEAKIRRRVYVDQREVVSARWTPITEALTLDLYPPIRKVLEARLSESSRAPS